MSVALTEDAVRRRFKTETRRLGWTFLEPGTPLDLCRKVMGRRKGEPLVRVAHVVVTDVRREPLAAITDAAVDREGFGPWEGSPGLDWWPPGTVPPAEVHGPAAERFVEFFTAAMRCTPDTEVTVIQWRYAYDCGHLDRTPGCGGCDPGAIDRVYVDETASWWEPTDDPAWWRTVDPCGDDCHHPVHAFGHPERLRHLEPASYVLGRAR